MEVSEYLVGSPAFKAGGTGDPRTAGSIPVHLRCYSPQGSIRPFGPRLALRLAGGRDRSDRLRSFELAVFAARLDPALRASTRAAVAYQGFVSYLAPHRCKKRDKSRGGW